MVSIIIRTKNEERWIESCLKSIYEQNYKDFEIILIDNQSTDKTVERANFFDVKVHTIEDYLPGKALNFGIEKSSGDIIVCLSGHCIPKNNKWLNNLIKDLDKPDIAGVYGRQEPMSFSKDNDKRDLMIVFGLDKKIQKKDPFFHNANSAFKRSTWEKFPFDDQITNIEDRVWGEKIISQGLKIIYEPEASVYHYHGIHQDGNPDRLRNVVRIIEELELKKGNDILIKTADKKDITAIIPIAGELQFFGDRPLIDYTILRAKQSNLINRVVVTTDNPKIIEHVQDCGIKLAHLRKANLSVDFVSLEAVFQDTVMNLEHSGSYSDLIIGLQVTYPFRPKNLIDNMINKLIQDGLDSVIPAYAEYRAAWVSKENNIQIYDKGFMPRKFKKDPLQISLLGLGFVGYPENIRKGKLIGKKVGIYELTKPMNWIEIRDKESLKLFEPLIAKQEFNF